MNQNNDPNHKKFDYEKLIKTGRTVFLATLALFVGYIKSSSFIKAVEQGNLSLTIILPTILVIITLSLGFLWLISSEYEFSLLSRHITKYVPEVNFSPILISYVIPIFITLLAIFSDKLIFYSFIFWLYVSFDAFASGQRSRLILRTVETAKQDREVAEPLLNLILNFYVDKPFEIRSYFMGTLSIASFFCAVIAKYITIKIRNLNFQNIGYILLICNIIINEIIIWIWRKKFYESMEKFENDKALCCEFNYVV